MSHNNNNRRPVGGRTATANGTKNRNGIKATPTTGNLLAILWIQNSVVLLSCTVALVVTR
jgi:hypothetical protein